MAITDELRAWAHGPDEGDDWLDRIDEFCDRIDAAHERACAEAYGNGVMSVPIALDESAYIKLPVDADGVPIHVGDRLTDGEYTFTVCELATFRDGSWSIRNEDGNAWAACDVTHRAPTVEDVLREFAEKITDSQISGMHPTYEEAIAEYAAKLQLAEEVDA